MKSTTISNTATKINGLEIQSSAYGRCIPIIYGSQRISSNLMFYDDFKATAHTTTTESSGGKGAGSTKQSNTTYTYTASIMFGLSEGPINGIGRVWSDKSETTLNALGLSLFNGDYNQSSWGHLTANHPDKALPYRGQAYLASPTFSLGDSAQLPNVNFEVYGIGIYPYKQDCNPRDIVVDFLINNNYGLGFPSSKIGDLTAFNNYCLANGILLSPMFDEQQSGAEHISNFLKTCNSSFVWSEGKLKIIPYGDSSASGNGVSYEPNLTPIYDLTDDDFIDFDEPIKISRTANADAYNHIKIEFLNRSNAYNAEIAEVKDLANIDLYGLRPSDTIQMHSICDADTAKRVAQLMLQRMLYVRNSYEFKVSWKYCLLEPMDLITLTDSALGLDKLVIRITEIEEDEEGVLTIRGEEFPFGIATATLYPSQETKATTINYYMSAGNINTPTVFEPPLLLSNNYEIWFGLSGGDNWGGADIWASYDGDSYSFVTTVSQPARTGYLTTSLTNGSTVEVDLSECKGNLISSSDILALIGNEIIKYSIVTLTGTNKYILTITERGAYNTKITNHSVGERFTRLDSSIAKYQFNSDMIGKTIYYKALSYNIFGSAKQSLDEVNPFTFLISGDLYPPAQVSNFGYTETQSGIELKWDSNTEIDIKNYEIRADNNWGDDNYLWRGFANRTIVIQRDESKIYYIKAIDSLGNYSVVEANLTVIPTKPTSPTNLISSFSVNSSSMAIVDLDWTEGYSIYGIDYYLIEYAGKTVKAYTTNYQASADWLGNQDFKITTVDKMGFSSISSVLSVTKVIPNSPIDFRSQVIDNNVLFYWGEPSMTSLPITSYELRRGESWDSATVIGKKSGGFTTVFESSGGNYIYLISAIDADNRYSEPVSIATTVSQPPDFILKADYNSLLDGTKVNTVIDIDNSMLMLVDASKTWESHFTSRGWNNPQSQIDSGFPIYSQPGLNTAYYEEIVDLETVIDSSRVTVNVAGGVIAGAVNTNCDISLSLDGTTWVQYHGSWQVYGTNFRYYKFRITTTSEDDKGLYKITSINSVLDSKLKNDAGMVNALNTDANGTIFNFNIPFIDITAIVCTPQGTQPLTPVYDFKDSTITGTYSISSNIGTINCANHGLITGQNVKLSFTTGNGVNGIYKVESVIDANSYTISMTASDTLGNVSSYAESARVYLFTNTGARASGTVSWNIKGY